MPSTLRLVRCAFSRFTSRSFLISAFLIILVSYVSVANAGEPVWLGTLDAGVREFRFVLQQVGGSEPKSWELVSLDEGNAKFKLSSFELTNEVLQFEIKSTKAKYTSKLDATQAKSTGKWEQRGGTFDLSFEKLPEFPVDKPTEVWSADLKTLLQKLKLQIRVYKNADGSEQIRFDSVSQKVGGFKASRTVEGTNWKIEVEGLQASFEGEQNQDGSEVTGKWKQGGAEIDLVWKKSMGVASQPAPIQRPQTPRPPYPYLIETIKFASKAEGVTLAGTLTIPQSSEAKRTFPLAILISGSGPQDRDETLLDHKPFAVLADALTRKGIAVLRFDDRGVGESTGAYDSADSRDFAEDVLGAIEFAKSDSRFDSMKIGLVGHSEGGIIGPLAAQKSNDVAWMVFLAAPGVNGQKILVSQTELISKAEGIVDEKVLEKQRVTQEAVYRIVLANPDNSLEVMTDQVMKELESQLPTSEEERTAYREGMKQNLQGLGSRWFRFFLVHEPARVLEEIKCPVLALNGELDLQVDPKLNLPAVREALSKNLHPKSAFEEMPDLNHLFQTAKTGSVREYQSIEETMSPKVLDRIGEWILGL